MISLRRAALAAIASSILLVLSGCGGTYRPIASPIPAAGGDPQAADSVAVLNQNPAGNASFTQINVGGDTNAGNLNVGANTTVTPNALGITFAGENAFVATADTSSNTVSVATPSISSVTAATLPTGATPSFVTATATTGQILVNMALNSNPGCPGTGSIGIIQASTAALTNTVCLAGTNPGFILVLPGDRQAVVLDATANTATFVDIGSATVSTALPVGTAPVWAASNANGNTVYVLNKTSGDITVIDAVAQVVSVSSIPSGGASPSVILADRALNRLYVSNTGANNVTVFDVSAPLSVGTTPLTTVAVGIGTAPSALAVTPNGFNIYVANTGSSFASIIDGNSLSVVSTLTPIPNDPTAKVNWVAVSKDGTKAYVAAVDGAGDLTNTTQVVQTSNNAPIVNLAPPQQSLTCVATTAIPCALQRPLQIVPRI